MKKAIVLVMVATGVVGAIIGVGVSGHFSAEKKAIPRPTGIHLSPPPTSVNSDPMEVFQRAFWKRPSSADKILHAERREWSDATGVRKWQWFIQVEPSPELVKRLLDDNVFNLVAASSVPTPEDAPEWFNPSPTGTEIFQAPQGNMYLIFDGKKNLLCATSSGGGFQPGVPEPSGAPPPAPASSGRLPSTPPPDSSRR